MKVFISIHLEDHGLEDKRPLAARGILMLSRFEALLLITLRAALKATSGRPLFIDILLVRMKGIFAINNFQRIVLNVRIWSALCDSFHAGVEYTASNGMMIVSEFSLLYREKLAKIYPSSRPNRCQLCLKYLQSSPYSNGPHLHFCSCANSGWYIEGFL